MPTQVQIRGAVQATQEARTLASRELDVNTTDGRLAVHDGSTSGGIPHPNYADIQNGEYEYAAASGTNTITASIPRFSGPYAAGQKFRIKLANTITGPATVNFSSVGALTLKKKNVAGGSLSAVASGDGISGGIYDIHILDSSNALLESVDDKASAGSLVYLGEQTASNSAALDFTSLITSDYNKYVFELQDIRLATAGEDLLARTSTNNGSSFDNNTNNYSSNYTTVDSAGTETNSGASNRTSHIIGVALGNLATGAFCGQMCLYNPLGTTNFKNITNEGCYENNAGNLVWISGGGRRNAAADIDAVRFLASSGNITSGTIRMYGVKNS